jgi:site-specific DNA-methyltransferase (adenine-specific)
MSQIARLGQYMTPDWAADALVERYFADLSSADQVLEPSCGRGAFLRAIPAAVPAIGVEVDAELAEQARRTSGRRVIVGDFRLVDIPVRPTAIIGNPPFTVRVIEDYLARADALLEEDGRVGLILPAFTFQTSNTAARIAERWRVQQDMLPRDLFPRLQHPLCFALLSKGRERGLVNFALYHELAAVRRLQARYQQLLQEGEGSAWAAVTRAALETLGGRATLQRLYAEIAGHRPTPNPWWQAKVRQQLQRVAVRVGAGEWATPEALAA